MKQNNKIIYFFKVIWSVLLLFSVITFSSISLAQVPAERIVSLEKKVEISIFLKSAPLNMQTS